MKMYIFYLIFIYILEIWRSIYVIVDQNIVNVAPEVYYFHNQHFGSIGSLLQLYVEQFYDANNNNL